MGERVHHGTTDVAKDVVHAECTCRIDVNNLGDEFQMSAGPLIYGSEDVVGDGGTTAHFIDVLVHPLIGLLAIFDQAGSFIGVVWSF